MPYHGHHHSTSNSTQKDYTASQVGAPGGPYYETQSSGSADTLGSKQLLPQSGSVIAGNDHASYSSRDILDMNSGDPAAQSAGYGFPSASSKPAPMSAAPIISQPFETPRRTQTFGRQPEELHIPQSNLSIGQHNSGEPPQHHLYQSYSSQEILGGTAPDIQVQQATPQGQQYSSTSTGMALPGALQSGRPGQSSSNTVPSTTSVLPASSGHSQQYASNSRSSTANHSHSYSRSSPTGLEQHKYVPFVNTPENPKFASPPNQRYTAPHTPQGSAPYSPLGLADIRPLGDSGLPDAPMNANPYSNDGSSSVPTNSNYLAPWAVYAFDWCKWPVQQQNSGDAAGKIAIGSYVEDGHNFVGTHQACAMW